MFTDGTFDELYMYYNHLSMRFHHDVTEKKILPLTDIASASSKLTSYEFEPSAEAILEVLLTAICRKLNLWCSY